MISGSRALRSLVVIPALAWSVACGADTPPPAQEDAAAPSLIPSPLPPGQETPVGPAWWPSRWGADDEAGATNWITPEKVMEATQLITTGTIYELGRVYEPDMPLFGDRSFALRIPGSPTGGPAGINGLVYNDEFISTEIGQIGTQFDGLGHAGVHLGGAEGNGGPEAIRYYNGFTHKDIATPYGMQRLGVEKMKPIFTRGILIDVAGYRGRMLDAGEEISVADLQGALQRQGLSEAEIRPGDAVLIHTGWGSLWKVDNDRYNSGGPGIGLEAARWLAEKQVSLVGSDHWAVEVVPNPDPNLVFVVHNELETKHGIPFHESLDLEPLVSNQVWQFAYIFVRVPIRGATGSPGSPIAVR